MVSDCVHHVMLNPKHMLELHVVIKGLLQPSQSTHFPPLSYDHIQFTSFCLVWIRIGALTLSLSEQYKQVKVINSLHHHLANNIIRDGLIS
jgi:hypothetical protein